MLDDYEKVVVTGGRGFIGHHLVRALSACDKSVVVLDREGGPADGCVEYCVADVRDAASVMPVLRGADLLFHLAGNPNGSQSVREPGVHFGVNCLGTFNLLEASVACGVRRFVYVSSASSYGKPRTVPIPETHPIAPIVPYGAAKVAGEHFGLPFVAARPFCVYGSGDNPAMCLTEINRYLRWHLNRLPIQIVGDKARKTRDFVHVSDLVAGLMLIADRALPGEVFNVGSGTEVSMEDVVRSIERATGRPAALTELTEVQEDTYRLVGDITKIRGLGYVPRVSLDDGVAQLAEEMGPDPELPSVDTIFRSGQRAEQLP